MPIPESNTRNSLTGVESTPTPVLTKFDPINRTGSHCIISNEHQSVSLPPSVKRTQFYPGYNSSDSDLFYRSTKDAQRKSKRKTNRRKSANRMEESSSGKMREEIRFPKISLRQFKSSNESSRNITPRIFEPSLNFETESYYVENEFTRFSSIETFVRVNEKDQGVSVIRSQRLYQLTKQLKKCHAKYNKLRGVHDRDQFLTTEILQRYVMALDLALSEHFIGIALELTQKIYDGTKYMLPLYSNIFYHVDGTHAPLPVVVNGHQNYKSASPIIYALNRIPSSTTTLDNSQLRLETHLTKLQLETLLLVIAPVESMIFRATLEVVPNTAFTAYQRLASLEPSAALHWENNSTMKKEYEEILVKFGLADHLGCKGSLLSINNTEGSSRKFICDSELEMSEESDGH